MKSQKGPKLVYFDIYERLDDQTLYSLFMIRKFAADNQLLEPGPDEGDVDQRKLENRFRCALVRANNPNYSGRRLPDPDGVVKNRGRIVDGWFGATVKLFLVDQLPAEKARLEEVRNRLISNQKTGKVRRPAISNRAWLAVAIFAAVACGAPPVRDVIGTMLKEGVAAAKELAYSAPPKTPEDLFQQAWVDYRAGAYEAAVQKAYSILADLEISQHLRANCWYLLGYLDWQKSTGGAALSNFEKAYGLYQASNDHANLYATSLAIAKVQIELGDLQESRAMLEAAMNHYRNDGGIRVTHLGRYFPAALDLAVAENDYEQALDFAIRRHDIYQGSDQLDLLAGAKSDLGFWYAVNGCSEKARKYTVQAEKIIFHLQDEKRHMENQVNWLLIDRLDGYKMDLQAVGSLQQWSKIRSDSQVEFYLDLALTLEPIKENADERCNQEDEPE